MNVKLYSYTIRGDIAKMPRQKKTILYLSDSEESEYSEGESLATQNVIGQPEMEKNPEIKSDNLPLDYPTEPAPPVPISGKKPRQKVPLLHFPPEKVQEKVQEKIPGVRKRDSYAILPKRFMCSFCTRPYCQKPALERHEETCTIKLKQQAERAVELHKIKDDSVRKLQAKQYYQEVVKPAREARRPVEYVKKKPGPKPKPIVVPMSESEESEYEEYEEEPKPVAKKQSPKATVKKNPIKKPAPPKKKPPTPPESESDDESDDYEPPPKHFAPPHSMKPPPRYVIHF